MTTSLSTAAKPSSRGASLLAWTVLWPVALLSGAAAVLIAFFTAIWWVAWLMAFILGLLFKMPSNMNSVADTLLQSSLLALCCALVSYGLLRFMGQIPTRSSSTPKASPDGPSSERDAQPMNSPASPSRILSSTGDCLSPSAEPDSEPETGSFGPEEPASKPPHLEESWLWTVGAATLLRVGEIDIASVAPPSDDEAISLDFEAISPKQQAVLTVCTFSRPEPRVVAYGSREQMVFLSSLVAEMSALKPVRLIFSQEAGTFVIASRSGQHLGTPHEWLGVRP